MTAARTDPIENVLAPSAIERALEIYQQMQDCDHAALVQARKAITDHVYALINAGANDEQRLVVGALTHVKALDRAHTAAATPASTVAPKQQERRGQPVA